MPRLPVREIRVRTLDDGRQELTVSIVGGEQIHTFTVLGYLYAEPEPPVVGQVLAWDLWMTAHPGCSGGRWGRLSIEPPPTREFDAWWEH